MPYSKDLRIGHGWFNTNINWFYDYLDNMSEELIVKTENFTPEEIQYHDNTLSEEIELRLNEYIAWKVFGETRKKRNDVPECFNDEPPQEFDEDPYGYVYHHILILVEKRKYEGSISGPWYVLQSTQPDSN